MKREEWAMNLADEIRFWAWWINEYKRFDNDEYIEEGGNPCFPNVEDLKECVKSLDKEKIKVLDVGSGATSFLAFFDYGKEMEVIAVDALADTYNLICKQTGVEQPVIPVQCDVEKLDIMFKEGTFDFVHMQNALDHCYDPVEGINQMVKVVKKGGIVYLRHHINVADRMGHEGLHKWNFDMIDNKFAVNGTILDTSQFASTIVETKENWIILKITK